MKIIFYFGILCVIAFEITKIYLLKYIPEGKGHESMDLTFFIHYWRWDFRLLFWMLILWGLIKIYGSEKNKPINVAILSAASITYLTNFILLPNLKRDPADYIKFEAYTSNHMQSESKIIGVVVDGMAKAYPLQFIDNHSQIIDSIGNKRAMITYCQKCKNGRVFEPITNGRPNQFALVGRDYCNSLFEDMETGSWWRQSDGMALAGKMKGTLLKELPFEEVSLENWVASHPETIIMQPTSKQIKVEFITTNSKTHLPDSSNATLGKTSFVTHTSKTVGSRKIISLFE
jgi:hypothetical protein